MCSTPWTFSVLFAICWVVCGVVCGVCHLWTSAECSASLWYQLSYASSTFVVNLVVCWSCFDTVFRVSAEESCQFEGEVGCMVLCCNGNGPSGWEVGLYANRCQQMSLSFCFHLYISRCWGIWLFLKLACWFWWWDGKCGCLIVECGAVFCLFVDVCG